MGLSGLDRTRFVAEAIASYEPGTGREAQLRELVAEFLMVDPLCVGRSDGFAHVTGTAFVVNVATQKILLHRHKSLKRWLPFGGHAASGELDPAVTAMRECAEESGLTSLELQSRDGRPWLVDIDIHPIPQTAKGPAHLHLDFRYLAITEQAHLPKTALGESSEIAWFGFSDLGPLQLNESLTRCVAKIANTSGVKVPQ